MPSLEVISHIVAVAELNKKLMQFLQWYYREGEPNITTLAMDGLSAGRRQKGGKSEKKIAREKNTRSNYRY